MVTAVAKAAFNSAVDAVRAGGRVVAVGLPPEAMNLDIPRLVLDGIQVVGSLVGTRQDLTEAFQFAAEGKVVPKVALRPLEDINVIFKVDGTRANSWPYGHRFPSLNDLLWSSEYTDSR
ncbi:alcohol dehydrogenase [Salmonella enterica subsp. enterica serovar Agona str. SA-2]|nr:alcohol dehydrogenase [Salmonella enterica subsp. enterica serovar Agona str. SA-2]